MIRGIQLLTLNIFGGTSKQGSFPKKSLWERRVRVPNVQGSRCGVWGWGSVPSPEKFVDFGS